MAFFGETIMAKKTRNAQPARPLAAGGAAFGAAELPPPIAGGIALEFRHGLGDLVQLSIVLKHFCKHNPGVPVDVICDPPKVRSLCGLERRRIGFGSPEHHAGGWDQVIRLDFPDHAGDVLGFPSTKPWRCLTEVMRIAPDQELFTYSVRVSDCARKRAARYLAQVTGSSDETPRKFPVMILHYQGTSSRMQKDLSHECATTIASAARLRGRAAVIFDLERISPVVDQSTVFSPLNGHPVWGELGHADPETMCAMIDQAELFIGIDSGPLHLAGATTTPTLAVWTHHHPTRFFDFAPNVVHLVPIGHRRLAPGPKALETFERRYRHHVYGNVTAAVVEEMEKALQGCCDPPKPRSDALPGLHSKSFDEQYYREHVLGGLDYLGHGDWQRDYAAWLADVFGWKGKRVVDVGCACGSILRGLGHAGIVVQGFDVSEFMVTRGRQKWPDQAGLMHVMDACNLHLFDNQEWEGVHAAQVAEHWRPQLVPHILHELGRVTKPGGLFFCCLDTIELFERNKRDLAAEDPTHVCVRTLEWWREQLRQTGWHDATGEFSPALREHKGSFLKRYDWDFFIARRRAEGGI
jgi:SAM-dependent methyltransferase